jgi:hypothetical protein
MSDWEQREYFEMLSAAGAHTAKIMYHRGIRRPFHLRAASGVLEMKRLSRIAIAVTILMCAPAGVLLAQSTPGGGIPPATAPEATPAPTADPAATPTADKGTGTRKKRPAKKMTRQQEIDKSIESGTVPSRYRSSVPQEYQQYVPFAK